MTAVFPLPSDIAPAFRRAALTLYAAGSEDREWVMAQLPDSDQSLLRKALGDLASIGIPRDPEMLRAVLGVATSSARSTGTATRSVLHLGHVDPVVCATLLRHEPPLLVACALRLFSDADRQLVLAQLPPQFRRQVPSVPDGDLPPRLREALSGRLREQLGETRSATGARALVRNCGVAVRRLLKGKR